MLIYAFFIMLFGPRYKKQQSGDTACPRTTYLYGK